MGKGLHVNADARWVRWLGAAFVAQFVTSLAAEALSTPLLAGSISAAMVRVADNTVQLRAAIVLYLATCVGIIVMTSLLYVILRGRSRPVALVALVLWLAEVMMIAVGAIGMYALLPLSADFVKTGAPPSSFYETLGPIFRGLAGDLSMLFFSLGAFLWYGLFYRSRLIPRALSIWALLAMVLVLAGTVPLIWDSSLNVPFALDIPYVPFELVVGLWLLIRGASPAFSTT
jgi:hypothetical protein